jgi:hypothetical protein
MSNWNNFDEAMAALNDPHLPPADLAVIANARGALRPQVASHSGFRRLLRQRHRDIRYRRSRSGIRADLFGVRAGRLTLPKGSVGVSRLYQPGASA